MKFTLLLTLLGGFTLPLSAFTFEVRSTADSGPLTLRDAIAAANASTDASRVITFSPVLVPPGSVIQLQSYIEITKPVTITGYPFDAKSITSSFSTVTIKGIANPDGNVFVITPAAVGQSVFRDLWIANGGPAPIGSAFPDGGAVHLSGAGVKLDLENCHLYNNRAARGGAIYCDGGEVKAIDCGIVDNNGIGGAMQANGGGKITGTRTYFYDNHSDGNGGAIVVLGGSQGTFRNCYFFTNRADEGGGAISSGGASTTDVLNCTFVWNGADDDSNGTGEGGALRSAVTGAGTFTVTNSLIAENGLGYGFSSQPDFLSDVIGVFASGGHNIVSVTDGSNSFGPTGLASGQPRESDITGTAAVPVATESIFAEGSYIRLDYDSIAHDAGDTAAAAALVSDYNGDVRVYGNGIDIGCVEAYPVLVTHNGDSGPGSLRQALLDQEVWIGFEATYFATARTISLLTPLPVVSTRTIIDGTAAARVNIGSGVLTAPDHLLTLDPLDPETIVTVEAVNFGPSNGPGLVLGGSGEGLCELKRCTVRDCDNGTQTVGAGGIDVLGTASMANCTVSGNSAIGAGGIRVALRSKLTMLSCTVTANHSVDWTGGVGVEDSPYSGGPLASFAYGNSIVADNFSVNPVHQGNDVDGARNSYGHNLIGPITSAVSPSDIRPLEGARLAPLAHNGESTFTHAPLLDSPAIDAGVFALEDGVVSPSRDQNASPRSSVPEIGATEWTPIDYNAWKPLVFTTTPAPQQGPGGDPDGDGLINAHEFYFGTSPTTPDAKPWSATMEGGNLVFRYPVARGRNTASAIVQVSTNLSTWNPATATPSFEATAGVQDLMKVVLQANLAKRFARLDITP